MKVRFWARALKNKNNNKNTMNMASSHMDGLDEIEILETLAYKICLKFINRCESCLWRLIVAYKQILALSRDNFIEKNPWNLLIELIADCYETDTENEFKEHLRKLNRPDIIKLSGDKTDDAKKLFHTKILLYYYKTGNIRRAKRYFHDKQQQLLHFEKLSNLLENTNSTYPDEFHVKNLVTHLIPFISCCMKNIETPLLILACTPSNAPSSSDENVRAAPTRLAVFSGSRINAEERSSFHSAQQQEDNDDATESFNGENERTEESPDAETEKNDQENLGNISARRASLRSSTKESPVQPKPSTCKVLKTTEDLIKDYKKVSTSASSSKFLLSPNGKVIVASNSAADRLNQSWKTKEKLANKTSPLPNTRRSGKYKSNHNQQSDKRKKSKPEDGSNNNLPSQQDQRSENEHEQDGMEVSDNSQHVSPRKSTSNRSDNQKSGSSSDQSGSVSQQRDEGGSSKMPPSPSASSATSSAKRRKKMITQDHDGDSMTWSDEDNEENHVITTHTTTKTTKNLSFTKRSKQRVKFTKEEEEYLRQGLKEYGAGNWVMIKEAFPFHPSRTNVSLKDKYRTMLKHGDL